MLRERLSFVLRRRSGPRIYSAGDSHSDALSGRPQVKVAHFGPVTAFRAGRDGELQRLFAAKVRKVPERATSRVVRAVVHPGDAVMLCFGEIDVRVHFEQQISRYGSATEFARFLAQRLAAEGRALADATRASVGLASVTPPVEHLGDPAFPSRGTAEQRVAWSRELNREYESACRHLGLAWIDTSRCYADDRGLLPPELSDGTVHLRHAVAGELERACREAFALGGVDGLDEDV